MSLFETNLQPQEKQLKQFGLICLFAFPAITWMWGATPPIVAIASAMGLALALLGITQPGFLKPVFVGFSIAALPIGFVMGELAMLLIFFGVFLPFGIFFKLIGRDPLQRRLDPTQKSYWQPKKQPRNAASYYHQS